MFRYSSHDPQADESASTQLNTSLVDRPWLPEYALGVGVDAVTGQLRAQAVEPFTVKDRTTRKSEYLYSLVQSESDLSMLISESIEGSYNIGGVTASASTSFLNSIAVSTLSVSLVAQVSVAHSQYALADSYRLKASPNPDFRRNHGDYFVAGHKAASSLSVVYQCRFTNAEQRTQFTATLALKAPEVMTAKGSAEFERAAKETSASVSIKIIAHGVDEVIPTPSNGWNPAEIVKTLLPWFEQHQAPDPLKAYLMHYQLVDPNIPAIVPVSPHTFTELAYLYDRFWLARGLYNTCPDFGIPLVERPYALLARTVEANQAILAQDALKIAQLTAQTQEVLATLGDINRRQAFASQLPLASAGEPKQGKLIDADKGRARWSFGFSRSDLSGVTIGNLSQSVSADWKIGWREHTFTFHDPTKLLVGWEIVCNRTDGAGGDWRKDCPQVIGSHSAEVFVKSDYDRGYSWTITWSFVDAALFPSVPMRGAGILDCRGDVRAEDHSEQMLGIR